MSTKQDLTVARVAIIYNTRGGTQYTLTCPAAQKDARVAALRSEGARVVAVRTAPAAGWQPK